MTKDRNGLGKFFKLFGMVVIKKEGETGWNPGLHHVIQDFKGAGILLPVYLWGNKKYQNRTFDFCTIPTWVMDTVKRNTFVCELVSWFKRTFNILDDLKNVKNTNRGMLLLVSLQLY